jgi:hypothetical protein
MKRKAKGRYIKNKARKVEFAVRKNVINLWHEMWMTYMDEYMFARNFYPLLIVV